MKKLAVGILAHVDAGKTTLSEAMLFTSGSIRRMGRVDKGDAFLDTDELEKKRGITIFSKQAVMERNGMRVTLLDTPGHVDFSSEMERTLQVLDYGILVISGVDGVQGHTRTLWRLLSRYRIPTFLFINKMDLAGERRADILKELEDTLSDSFVDFGEAGTESFFEAAAMCGEEALNQFLERGSVEPGEIRRLIRERRLFPCFFGSALKLQGVEEFLAGLEEYTVLPDYPDRFGAKVFKIARDGQGNRLTYMKITGGKLAVKDLVEGEKVNQLRIYSGERFETVKEAEAGDVCAAAGLLKTAPGQGLGIEAASSMPLLEPVLTYRILLPEGVDAAAMLPKLAQLEEEDPKLHITWEESGEIHAQIMGEIQMEVVKSLILERFGAAVEFGERSIVYKETIKYTVEGVGHYEPLRHYAEVHFLMEPGEAGSGLVFSADCGEDILDRNWQRLILTHLREKEHRGVLTGSPITDMRITLKSGRAHLKHTEGGDFRQAVYRAVRQGLFSAESVLLEPFYEFRLEVPEKMVGKAMTDVERMSGSFDPPQIEDGFALLCGSAPAACMDGYQREVTAYTGGRGRLSCVLKGYGPCHNAEEVLAASRYDAEGDLENPSASVFCAHGAGFVVNWDEVKEYMHLESCLKPKRGMEGGPSAPLGGEKAHLEQTRIGQAGAGFRDSKQRKGGSGGAGGREELWVGTEEVDAILEKTFYANAGQKGKAKRSSGLPKDRTARRETQSPPLVRSFKREEPREEYLLVDGYNIIFAWERLRELAGLNIDSARGALLDILCNYQGIRKCQLIAVFDAYRVQGHATEYLNYHNIHVVYTKEAETADQYIEKFAHENGKKYDVMVATSDRLEQIIIRGQGCRLISARELEEEIGRAEKEMRQDYEAGRIGASRSGEKNYLLDSLSEEEKRRLKEI